MHRLRSWSRIRSRVSPIAFLENSFIPCSRRFQALRFTLLREKAVSRGIPFAPRSRAWLVERPFLKKWDSLFLFLAAVRARWGSTRWFLKPFLSLSHA